MDSHPAHQPLLARVSGGLAVPLLAKVGVATIAAGLVADTAEHVFISHAGELILAGFAIGEHVAHLVVLIGMVLVLVGIVAHGMRSSGRTSRPEGSPHDAVR